jgi:pectate lyase-like protein
LRAIGWGPSLSPRARGRRRTSLPRVNIASTAVALAATRLAAYGAKASSQTHHRDPTCRAACTVRLLAAVGAVALLGAGQVLDNQAIVGSNADLSGLPSSYANFVVRNDFAAAIGAPPLTYKSSASACSLNSGAGDGGSQVPTSDNGCWLAQFPSTGIDVREFGADSTGVTDSVPAFNKALALAKAGPLRLVVPPGTYTIKSTQVGPYPLLAGPQGIVLFCSSGAHCSNVDIEGYGATITADNTHNNASWVVFDYVDGLTVRGLTFLGNPTGLTTDAEPTAFLLTHITNWKLEDITLTGNWGGSTRSPGFLAGNWLTDGKIDGVDLPAVGICADIAFVSRLTVSHVHAAGANDSGTTLPGSRSGCFMVEYDARFATDYPSAVTFLTSDHIVIDSTNTFTNFAAGGFFRAGGPYVFEAQSYNNSGAGSYLPNASGAGLLLYNDTNACCLSATDPVHDVTVSADLSGNGTSTAGAGVIIDGHVTNAGEKITNVIISGSKFNNNTNTAIKTLGPYVSGTIVGQNLYTGANQTTAVDSVTQASSGFHAR